MANPAAPAVSCDFVATGTYGPGSAPVPERSPGFSLTSRCALIYGVDERILLQCFGLTASLHRPGVRASAATPQSNHPVRECRSRSVPAGGGRHFHHLPRQTHGCDAGRPSAPDSATLSINQIDKSFGRKSNLC